MNKLKYILSIFITIIALYGCASAKEEKQPTNPLYGKIHEECYDAAKYAKTMAVLRDARIPTSSLDEYSSKSLVVTFPIKTIQYYVLVSKSSPPEAYSSVLALCDKFGWYRLEAELKTMYPEIPQDLKEQDINIYPKKPKNEKLNSNNINDPTCLSGIWVPLWMMNKEGTKILWSNFEGDNSLTDLYLNPNIERDPDNKIFYVCGK